MADFHLWFKEIDRIIDEYKDTLKDAIKYDNKHKFRDSFECILLEILGMDDSNGTGNIQINDILERCKKAKRESREGEYVDIGINKTQKSWNSWLYDELELKYGGVHYLSRTLGLWFRVVFGEDWYSEVEQKITEKRFALDVHKHEETYDLLPRRLNIFVDADQKEIVSILLPSVDGKGDAEAEERRNEVPQDENTLETSWLLRQEQFEILQKVVRDMSRKQKYHRFMQGENDLLEQSDLEEFLNNIPSEGTFRARFFCNAHYADEDVFRKITFMLFRTLLLDFHPQFILIAPIVDSNGEHFTTFVGIFRKQLSQPEQDELRFFFDHLLGKISQFEFAVKNETSVSSIVFVEDNVRRCSTIRPYEETEIHPTNLFHEKENEYGKLIEEVLTGNGLQSDESLDELRYHFVGASDKMVAILKKMGNYLQTNAQKSASVLLYSEPGNGKENIAKLCHLYAKRYYTKEKITNEIFAKLDTKPFWEYVKGPLQRRIKQYIKTQRIIVKTRVDNVPFELDEEEYKRNGLNFNWFPFHCGLLTKQNIQKLLFGEYWKNERELIPGEFLLADLTSGTILFDELNTLSRPELSSWFLRVLEKPNAIVPENYHSPIEDINVLTIFTSNLSPEELKMKGFNPALLSRLRAHEIPPLRERPEDIPLLVKYFVWKSRKDISDKSDKDNRDKDYVNVTRIDTKGLHILCRLPWKDNTRELKRFVDDVMASRIERKILTREISFDEIMRCIIEHEKKLLNK